MVPLRCARPRPQPRAPVPAGLRRSPAFTLALSEALHEPRPEERARPGQDAAVRSGAWGIQARACGSRCCEASPAAPRGGGVTRKGSTRQGPGRGGEHGERGPGAADPGARLRGRAAGHPALGRPRANGGVRGVDAPVWLRRLGARIAAPRLRMRRSAGAGRAGLGAGRGCVHAGRAWGRAELGDPASLERLLPGTATMPNATG